MVKRGGLLVSITTLAAVTALVMMLVPRFATAGDGAVRKTASDASRYVFGHDAVIDAPLGGNLQVYFGSADIRNVVHGNVLVFGGSIRLSGAGHVTGDLISGGGPIEGATGRVDGHVYAPGTVRGAAAMLSHQQEGDDLVIVLGAALKLSLLALWLIVAVAATLLGAREVRFGSVEIRSSPLHCFTLGLVAFTSFVLTAILFSYLVPYFIGIPLLALLGTFAAVTKIFGMVAVFHSIGVLVAGARTPRQLANRRWFRGDLAMTVIGVLLLGAIRMIPVVGTLVWSCASIFGVGVALATKFGRREPWFLTWTTVEA
jgi:hypothetical protein